MTAPAQDLTVSPRPSLNQVDGVGVRSANQIAREIIDQHAGGLRARYQRDLECEKFLLHIDGGGDSQWADILWGAQVEIPPDISEYRHSENLLRPIVDNAVAHHTSMPLRYYVGSQPDRDARDRAIVDALWMNHVVDQQDLNGLFADALYLAMPAGFCPVHAYWREDRNDQYAPLTPASQDTRQPGMLDCWLGNPFDTVFDRHATRGSIYWASYGRMVPAQLVRQAFDHVEGVPGLQGTKQMPSVAVFQRIARNWRLEGLGRHGSPVIEAWRQEQAFEEESLLLLCREILPGVNPAYPGGRLQIVAVPEAADLRRGQGGKHGILLVDQPLPGGTFSFGLFYSHHRSDDVLGKPWVADLDDLQVRLNITISHEWEFIEKVRNAPIMGPGGVVPEDMLDLDGYAYLEIPQELGANARPRVVQWQAGEVLQALDKKADGIRRAMWTIGGYQAASRGESLGSRTAAKTIMALQHADSTIHTPVNKRFQRSAADFARVCHAQMRMYGDVAWLVEITGDEYAHLAAPYIDRTMLSERPPNYKLINSFGTPEAVTQEILQLMTVRGADGDALMTTEEGRRHLPQRMVFDGRADPKTVARRRAKTVAVAIQYEVKQFREQTGMQITDAAHPWIVESARMVFATIQRRFGVKRSDDLMAHVARLTELVQDEAEDPITRQVAEMRLDVYYQWQAMQAQIPVDRPQQPNTQRPEPTDQQQAATPGGTQAVLNA